MEYSLALSYLQLYTEPSKGDGNDEKVGGSTAEKKSDDDNTLVWERFEWSTKELADVETSLKKSEDRCRIDPALKQFQVQQDDDAWNGFYSHHATSFFKDRHYLPTAFPHEFGVIAPATDGAPSCESRPATEEKTLIEIGCGVGNALLPLLEEEESVDNPQTKKDTSKQQQQQIQWTVYGLDLSSVAIELLQKDSRFRQAAQQGRAYAYVANIVHGIPPACQTVADVASLLFCLSAIDPTRQATAVQHVVSSLKPGGVIVFRDYGRWDESQVKLGSQRSKLIKRDFYQKNDGTKCYFFSTQDLRDLFQEQAGLEVVELEYINRLYKNRATDATRRRVWVHGRFRKVLE